MSGKTVTKSDLALAIKKQVGLSKSDSLALVGNILSEISESLSKGETVKLSSFGSFNVRHKKQRIGRNPRTGKEYIISARHVVTFKASVSVRQQMLSQEKIYLNKQ